MKLFLQVIAISSTILFIIAGFKLTNIHSVSGDSIAEVYYSGVGFMSFAFSLFSGGLLIALAERYEVNCDEKQ